MPKFKILFLLLLLLFCRHKKYGKVWEFPSSSHSPSTYFSYGVQTKEELVVNQDVPPQWGPSLKIADDSICLNSQDDFFRSQEFGPRLGVCFDSNFDNQTLLESSLLTLNELDDSKVRPDGFLTYQGSQAHLYFLSLTEIVNEISSSSSRRFLLGDNRLHTALEKRMDLTFENYKSIAGGKEKRIETSFALPYFSIYSIDGVYKIVFPPMDSAIPRSQYHYLVLEITNLPDFIADYETNFAKVQSINESWIESCIKEKFVLTEVMGYASGSTKRFIEYSGSKDNSTCVSPITLELADNQVSVDTNSEFLFPGAVKLFIEEGSSLQGTVVKDLNWKDIKSSKTLKLTSSDLTDTWVLPENLNFHWSDEEFSLKKTSFSCEWTSSILRNSKFCGDPGMEVEGLGLTGVNFCNPEDFTVSELNAFGLKLETKVDKYGKFVELKYIGANECKLVGLNLLIGENLIPMHGSGVLAKPNSYWVISEGRHFTGLSNLIRRNLDFFQWQNPISIRNYTSSKLLWKGLKEEDIFLSEMMNGSISSMVVTGDSFYHHPNKNPTYLQAGYRASHAMSPGAENTNLASDAGGELSEVLWAGGYKNSISIPDEKFIEIKSKGEGTLELEVKSGTSFSRFYIPVSRLDAFTVLSKGKFECFPNARSIQTDRLSLSGDFTNLKLKSLGQLVSELNYDSQKGHGYSNSSQKIRASYVNSGANQVWQNSNSPTHISIAPDCMAQVYATPDSANEFEPFLADDGFDYMGTGRFLLAASVYDQNLPYRIALSSYLPLETIFIALEKTGIGNLLKPVVHGMSSTGLIYQVLESHSDLKIYNRDGVFMEGIMANPSSPQNEWILFCNRSSVSKDLADYEIEDSSAVDRFDSYFNRKGISLPTGVQSPTFIGNSTVLASGQCGYLIDPDSSVIKLKPKGIAPTLVLTVKTSSTIGSAISSGEMLDLFKYNGTERIHVHSFGNRYSPYPFAINVNSDEIILLLPNKRGESKYDYEVLKW